MNSRKSIENASSPISPENLNAAINLRLALLGLPLVGSSNEGVMALVEPILARQRELSRRLADKLCPVDARIHDLQKELAKFEQVKKFTLLPSAFSMELGEITPTMKLRRKIIESKYQSEIEAMYSHA